MTSQQDTELEEILEHLLIDYDYDVKDKDDVTFNRAIQALISWKDKEVERAERRVVNVVANSSETVKLYRHTKNVCPVCKSVSEGVESLQSQGGKNE